MLVGNAALRLRVKPGWPRQSAVLVAVLTSAAVLGWRLWPPRTEIFDLIAETSRMASDGALIDQGRIFRSTPAASLHLHVMGRRQRCPLHVHPDQHEVAVVVAGSAQVSQVLPGNGPVSLSSDRFGPGDLVHSPPWCGHQWVNPSAQEVLATLVFSSPPWRGNLYVAPDDDLLRRGGAASNFRLSQDLAGPGNSGSLPSIKEVVLGDRRLRLVVTEGSFSLEGRPNTALFVRAGRGRLHRGLAATRLGPGQLVLLPPGGGGTFAPEAGQRLAFVIFDLG